MRTLLENEHFCVSRFESEPILSLVRTAVPFASAEQVAAVCTPVAKVLEQARRDCRYLLLDTRDAVGNNDPRYEQSYADFRAAVVRGFDLTAIVVRTMVGKLQSRRLLAADRASGCAEIFDDYLQALRFLRAAARGARRTAAR